MVADKLYITTNFTYSLCHRVYSEPGGSFAGFIIYDNGIEIINIGSLSKKISIEDLTLSRKSVPKNPLIANIFYQRKMLENCGHRLELMYKECKHANLPIPTLIENEGEVTVTFYFKEQVTEQVRSLLKILPTEKMSIREILKALRLKHLPTLSYDYIQPAIKTGLIEHPLGFSR